MKEPNWNEIIGIGNIRVALQRYHNAVVVPMQEKLDEVEKWIKRNAGDTNGFGDRLKGAEELLAELERRLEAHHHYRMDHGEIGIPYFVYEPEPSPHDERPACSCGHDGVPFVADDEVLCSLCNGLVRNVKPDPPEAADGGSGECTCEQRRILEDENFVYFEDGQCVRLDPFSHANPFPVCPFCKGAIRKSLLDKGGE